MCVVGYILIHWNAERIAEQVFSLYLTKKTHELFGLASGPITSWEIDGETVETASDFVLGAPKSLQMVIAAIKLKDAYSLEGKLWPT